MRQSVHLTSYQEEERLLADWIRRLSSSGDVLRILEAGCGRRWPLDLSGVRYHLTGLDLDKHAIEARLSDKGDLDKSIVADLRTVVLPDNHFDVIYCSDVLEHIKGARAVLDRMFRWLKPSGILILRIPDGDSAYGFATRMTSYQVHVLYHRYARINKHASKPGYRPYPTVYDPVVNRRGLSDYCRATDHVMLAEYRLKVPICRKGAFATIVRAVEGLLWLCSCGRLTTTHRELTYVVQNKQPVLADTKQFDALDGETCPPVDAQQAMAMARESDTCT